MKEIKKGYDMVKRKKNISSIDNDDAAIAFKDHIRVDKRTVEFALSHLTTSETMLFRILWHDKVIKVLSLIKSMSMSIDEKITSFPWYHNPDRSISSWNVASTKAKFYDFEEKVETVIADTASVFRRVLKYTQSVEPVYKLEAVISFCTFSALRMVSALQKFDGLLMDENNNSIVRLFNDLPRIQIGRWLRCVPYESTTGLLAFGESTFLRCRVGESEDNYQYLLLPAYIAERYQENQTYPPYIYYKWILPQWLYVSKNEPPPRENNWHIWVLMDDYGKEKYFKNSSTPWDKTKFKSDMENEICSTNKYNLPSGIKLEERDAHTVLNRQLGNDSTTNTIMSESVEAMTKRKPLKLFYSYSRADSGVKDNIEEHLSSLKYQNIIESWHDREIPPGMNWHDEIDKHLKSADIILFLISSDFLASEYVRRVEVEEAMKKHEAGEARVIPIVVRDCDWQNEIFGQLQALPEDGSPVLPSEDQDKVLKNIALKIRAVAEEIGCRSTKV